AHVAVALEHRTPAVSAALGDATPSAAEAPRQHELAGFDPAERIGASAAEEELLDIPAFLRRQAN
ncbi:MAG: cell division protein FtsZ, partial [Rhodospirillales bacterium]|nr:cell division protein FtsZ [Rhodospirillales bacterium]